MRVLVTGGGGFLGRRIVELLLDRGDEVTFLARGHYPEVEALGAEGLQIDLQDADAVASAVHGKEAIIHVAAKAGYYGDIADYRGINVDGTRHLLDAAERHDVARFVYTSTPSVTRDRERRTGHSIRRRTLVSVPRDEGRSGADGAGSERRPHRDGGVAPAPDLRAP